MLAHLQGQQLNQAQLARALNVDGKTVGRYLDLLVDLLLVYRLQPWPTNTGKRLVKSPKVYIRDSGIVHALLGLSDHETLLGHPVVGFSWEGFVLENIVSVLLEGSQTGFYRTSAGAEIDLILRFATGDVWAVEIKRSIAPKARKGFHIACNDIQPDRRILIYSGDEAFEQSSGIEVQGLRQFLNEVSEIRQ